MQTPLFRMNDLTQTIINYHSFIGFESRSVFKLLTRSPSELLDYCKILMVENVKSGSFDCLSHQAIPENYLKIDITATEKRVTGTVQIIIGHNVECEMEFHDFIATLNAEIMMSKLLNRSSYETIVKIHSKSHN